LIAEILDSHSDECEYGCLCDVSLVDTNRVIKNKATSSF